MTGHAVTGVPELDARLERGEVLVLDGGMGAELEARGVPMDHDAWSAVANLEQQDTVEQAHVDFLTAGADIIIANTFAAGLHALEAAGLAARFEEANRSGVEAALGARDRAGAGRPVAVAGSISPLSVGAVLGFGGRSREELRAAYRRQAAALAEAGVDLIVTEMIQSAEWHGPAVEAAVETGLPTWLGVSAGPATDDDRVPTLEHSDVALEEVVDPLVDLPVSAVAVMHTDVDAVDGALAVVRRAWSGPVAVYPHRGEYRPPSWTFHEIDPAELCARARNWVDAGAAVVGGCCGIGPQHIEWLARCLHPRD